MKRTLVSFQGNCPLRCRHCYTPELCRTTVLNVDDVVNSIQGTDADIIYVSHDYENFYEQDKGLELCEKLYDTYGTHLLIITRMNLRDDIVRRLSLLEERMRKNGKWLILSESIFAMQSHTISESNMCPIPEERINTLKRAHAKGIPSILMLRPVFPEKYVKMDEYEELISRVSGYIDAVVTSGLIITDGILQNLEISAELDYGPNLGSEYLSSVKNPRYVNTDRELNFIKSECKRRDIPCYPHSMEAIERIIRGNLLHSY